MSEDKMGTVSRAMAVLTAIAEADSDIAIIDLAAALDLPQSTCHRLLDLLAADGFVQRNAKLRRYGAGPSLQRLAALVAGRTDFATLAAPIMQRLTQESGETALLGRYDARERTLFFVHSADAPNPLRYRIDLFKPTPAGCGASGRAAAAFLPQEDWEVLFEGVANRWASPEAFATELTNVRARGYAVSRSEKLEGAVGIGAPVFAKGANVIGSLSVTIPEQRFDEAAIDEIAAKVMRAAADLSRLQGGQQPEKSGA